MGAKAIHRLRKPAVSFFILLFGVFASANADFLELEKKSTKSDLKREGRLVSRINEKSTTPIVRRHQFAFSGNMLSVGKFSNIEGGQANSYKMSALPGFNFEYSQSLNDPRLSRFRTTLGAGFTRAYQTGPSASHTVLSVFPIELFGEYMFKLPKRTVVPYAGVGSVAYYAVQRGESAQSAEYWQLVPALTVGFEWQTPWQWAVHTRFRETQNLKANTNMWSGEIYDLGVAYRM